MEHFFSRPVGNPAFQISIDHPPSWPENIGYTTHIFLDESYGSQEVKRLNTPTFYTFPAILGNQGIPIVTACGTVLFLIAAFMPSSCHCETDPQQLKNLDCVE